MGGSQGILDTFVAAGESSHDFPLAGRGHPRVGRPRRTRTPAAPPPRCLLQPNAGAGLPLGAAGSSAAAWGGALHPAAPSFQEGEIETLEIETERDK